jgi:hypothetical protein
MVRDVEKTKQRLRAAIEEQLFWDTRDSILMAGLLHDALRVLEQVERERDALVPDGGKP